MEASSGIDAWICSLTDISCYIQVYNLTGDSPEFEQFLYDPSIPKNKKVPALNAILDKMEVSDVTRHFLGKGNFPLSVFAWSRLSSVLQFGMQMCSFVQPFIIAVCVYRGSGQKQQAEAFIEHQ